MKPVPLLGAEGGRWEGLGSLATVVAVLALGKQSLPHEWTRAFHRLCLSVANFFNPWVIFTLPEFPGSGSSAVEPLYEQTRQYLSLKGTSSAYRVTISQPKNTSSPTFTLVSFPAELLMLREQNNWLRYGQDVSLCSASSAVSSLSLLGLEVTLPASCLGFLRFVLPSASVSKKQAKLPCAGRQRVLRRYLPGRQLPMDASRSTAYEYSPSL